MFVLIAGIALLGCNQLCSECREHIWPAIGQFVHTFPHYLSPTFHSSSTRHYLRLYHAASSCSSLVRFKGSAGNGGGLNWPISYTLVAHDCLHNPRHSGQANEMMPNNHNKEEEEEEVCLKGGTARRSEPVQAKREIHTDQPSILLTNDWLNQLKRARSVTNQSINQSKTCWLHWRPKSSCCCCCKAVRALGDAHLLLLLLPLFVDLIRRDLRSTIVYGQFYINLQSNDGFSSDRMQSWILSCHRRDT